MESESQHRAGGFNWVALLFLTVFIAVAGFGLIPWANTAHETGRRTTCQSNARCIAVSLLCYEAARNEFPGYSNVLETNDKKFYRDPKTGLDAGVSWTVLIMQMDRPDLLEAWKTPAHEVTPAIEALRHAPLAIYACPSDPPTSPKSLALSYVVNCGMRDWAGSEAMPRDWAENGVFFDHFSGDKRVAANKASQIPIVRVRRVPILPGVTDCRTRS